MPTWPKNRIFLFAIFPLIVIAGLLLWFFVPFMISNDLIKDRFEQEISDSIGQPVKFGRNPKVTLWPSTQIKLENVVIGEGDIADDGALMIADAFSANVSVVSALLGEPEFSNYVLVRPTINLEIYPDGSSNWLPAGGTTEQNTGAEAISDETTSEISDPTENEGQDHFLNFDDLKIEGGTIVLVTNPGSEPERISSINGSLSWPTQDTRISANLTAIVRGEEINLVIDNANPISMFAGESVSTQIDMSSALINFGYDGTIEFGSSVFFDGQLAFDTPSVRRALEWSGSQIRPGTAIGSVEMTASISGDPRNTKFEDLIIRVGENRGLGILDFSILNEAPPLISGTLAFNTLDVESFLRAFTPLPESGDEIADTIDTQFLKQLGLDLRLSAQEASFGVLEMSNLAAAVQVTEENATLNIGGADAYDGQIIGRVSISDKGIDGGGEISVSARDINFETLFNTLEVSGPLPLGIGDLDLKLRSERPLWATSVTDIKGDFSMSVADGTIPGLNLTLVREQANQGNFFNLEDVSDGELDFTIAELETKIDGGVANLGMAKIVTENETISFTGIAPFAKGSLALLGFISEIEAASEQSGQDGQAEVKNIINTITLFIGGSWPNPVISPPVPDMSFQ